MFRLIGIGGVAESGKDAVADILVEHHGFYKTYMSKPLEKALLTLSPWIFCSLPALRIGEDSTVRDLVRKKLTEVGVFEKFLSYFDVRQVLTYDESKQIHDVRRLLQVLGTEIGRDMFGADCWVKLAAKDIHEHLNADQDVVITGIRFHNELRMIHEFSGEAWWVSRPGYAPVNSHSSDNTLEFKDFDFGIDNCGSLENLANLVESAL